jgi:predicted ATPase
MGDANLLGLFEILRDAARKNATRALTQLTGGLEESFAKQDALEKAVARIGEELHSQYLLSFHPVGKDPGRYYRIEIQVKGNPNARVRTRPGYWLAAEPE